MFEFEFDREAEVNMTMGHQTYLIANKYTFVFSNSIKEDAVYKYGLAW